MSLVTTLASLKQKVAGDPQSIMKIAAGLRTVAEHVTTSTGRLTRYVNEVDSAWGGSSADAFKTYMTAYPKAGEGLQGAVITCATALDTAAGALETAHSTINNLHTTAVAEEGTYKRNHPDASADDVEKHLTGVSSLSGAVGKANQAVTEAETALTTAKKALTDQLGEDGFRYFHNIRQPDGADFEPGDHKVDWQKTTGYKPTTTLSSAGGPNGGSGSTGGGTTGGGAGAPSSYGDISAVKPQIVGWIKEALTIIKSPEMAAILRKRGLDVSNLDPNDPLTIERIAQIIAYESGGNPNAINNWDINAQNGVPSQGLMQTIPPTFNAHMLPPYDKIREPVDNIIAGVLYTYSRYGDLANHPGIKSLEHGGTYKPY
ncbi:transglycosylase SLT domain-containing protein [Nonomuraea sp. NPDC002799]